MKNAFIICEEENWFVATDFLTGITSQGKTIEESKANLIEALSLYYEDALYGVTKGKPQKIYGW